MRIIFAGTPDTAVPSLERLLAAGHDVVAVLTRAPARAGRSHTLRKSAVHEAADLRGITVFTPTTLRDPAIQESITALDVEAVAVVAYGLLVPPELLNVPRHGWVNLHFSLLPLWRGAAPVQYSIAAGDDVTGASTFRLEAGLDTGPVYGSTTEVIRPADTAGELLARLALSGAELLARTFSLIEAGKAAPVDQTGEPSYAPTIKVADAQVNWEHPAIAIDRQIRAHTPAPGAWTLLDDARVKIGPVALAPEVSDLLPGEIRDGYVGTGSHAIRLGTVAPAGKKAMNARDWLRGARLAPGTRLTSKEMN